MGNISFFYSGDVDEIIAASIDLALIFKCSPYEFLSRNEDEVIDLYKRTGERIKDMKPE